MKFEDFIDVRDGTHDSPKAVEDGVYLLTTKGLKNQKIDFEGLKKVSFQDAKKINERSIVEQYDILLSMIGTVGNVYQERKSRVPYVIKNVALLKFHGDKLLSDWTYYYLLSPSGQQQINLHKKGSTQQFISLKDIRNISVDLPSRSKMKLLVKKLSVVNDKILLNEQINDNLLELTQSIYQRLNDRKNTNGALSSICHLVTNKVDTAKLNTNNFWSTSNLLSNKRGATQAKEMPKSTKCTAVSRYDTLFGNIRPYFKKVLLAPQNGGCSPDVLVFKANTQKYQAYLYSIVASDKFIDQVVAGSKGTKMPRGDKAQMIETPIYIPSDQELKGFNKAVLPSLISIQTNSTENEYLTVIKQQLLSKYF